MSHYSTIDYKSQIDKFQDLIDINGPIIHTGFGPCWVWIGTISKGKYPKFGLGMAAHWSFEHFVGAIPLNHAVRSICDNHLCVRPDHLIAQRFGSWKTECPFGHIYDAQNTIIRKSGHRQCKACVRAFHHIRRCHLRLGERIDIEALFDRDGGICQLCFLSIDRSLDMRHPMMKSIDHIEPIILGGTHTWDNVQIAHLVCNQRKGASLEV